MTDYIDTKNLEEKDKKYVYNLEERDIMIK